jgi:ElaB/YqjD/DUF883 family membrane-anchored ribosome-binding protein
VSYDVSAEIADTPLPLMGCSPAVAKKRPVSRSPGRKTTAGGSRSSGDKAAASPVDEARETLQQAEENYRRVRDQAAERLAETRRMTIGEAIDGSLELVRRHPVGGLCAAGFLGFLIGRLLRR